MRDVIRNAEMMRNEQGDEERREEVAATRSRQKGEGGKIETSVSIDTLAEGAVVLVVVGLVVGLSAV